MKLLINDHAHGRFSDISFEDDSLKRNLVNEIVQLSIKYSIESKFAKYVNLIFILLLSFLFTLLLIRYIMANQRELEVVPKVNDIISKEKIDQLSSMSFSATINNYHFF